MIPNNQFWYENNSLTPLLPSLIGNFIDSSDISKGDVWNSAKYTDNGGVSTFVGNSIILNGGVGDFSKWLEYNTWLTDRENLKWTDTFTINSVSPSTSGYGMQFNGRYSQYFTLALGMDTGANNGTLFIFDNGGGIIAQATNVVPISTGNNVTIVSEIIDATTAKITVTNNTTTISHNLQFTFNFNYPFIRILPVVAKFRSILFGCNITLISRTIESVGEYTYPDAIFCGDSKIKGYFATGTNTSNTAIGLLRVANPLKKIYNLSGANETIQDMHDRLPEILSYNSDPTRKTKVFIIIGCNDVRNSTFNTTTKNLVISDFNTLKSSNFDPYICYAIPENTLDVTVYNNWVISEPTFVGKIITATYLNMWSGTGTTPNPTYISTDGIHPNLAGQSIIKNIFNSLI